MESNSAKKTSFGEAMKLCLRGLKILHGMFPGWIAISTVHATLGAVQPLFVLFFSSAIITELSGARDVRTIALYAALAVGTTCLISAVRAVLGKRLNLFQSVTYPNFYKMLHYRFAELKYSEAEKASVSETSADMRAKMNGNGLGLPQVFWNFPGLVGEVVSLLGSAALLAGMFRVAGDYIVNFYTSTWPLVILLALIVLCNFLSLFIRKRQAVMIEHIFRENPKANTFFQYYFRYTGVDCAGKDIRLYNQEPAIREIADNSTGIKMWFKYFTAEGRFSGLFGLLNAVMGGAVYLFIGLRALFGMYGLGAVIQYVGAVTTLVTMLGAIIVRLGFMMINAPHLEQLFSFLDLPDESDSRTGKADIRQDSDYEVEFHNVSFKYPGTDTYALRNLSLKFHTGRRLAVVGQNGSGKTTMIKLLCRLYDPDEGKITLDGVDIRDYNIVEYRSIFSVVFQDFVLTALPLGQNVASAEEYDRERVLKCLELAGMSTRMEGFSQGLDTPLYRSYDEEGSDISGGEAQKVALARALYKDAPFVVLDEPTAALDPIAEFEVYSSFNDTVGDRTAIFVSHRLSSCRFCHDIAVFHEGSLVQRGSHDQLLADSSGKYHQLWHAQSQYYAE